MVNNIIKNHQKPIKVLAVVCQMNLAGLENRLMDIIRTIDYQTVCIDIFTYRKNKGTLDDEIVFLGGTVYYNPPLTPQNMFSYIKYFKNFLNMHPEYHIVHAHQDAWCSVFCCGASLAGVPVRIAHSRTSIKTISLGNIFKNIIRIPTRWYASHYFAVSEAAGKWLFGKRNMDKGNVVIWKNAIDCQKYRFNIEIRNKMRHQLNVDDFFVIMHVGNFTVPKNQGFLLNVLKEVRKQENAVLVLVGKEGPSHLMQKMKDKAAIEDMNSHIMFLDERNDVASLLQAADIFCFPSIFEGLPGAVLEAQAAGLPCIISDSITPEVCVLKTTERLSLKEKPLIWSNAILNHLNTERIDTYNEMVSSGYDIHSLVEKLTAFYVQIGEKENVI